MCVRSSSSNWSREVDFHLSRSESTQRAIKEHSSSQRALKRRSEGTQRALKIRVVPSEPKILRLVFMEYSKRVASESGGQCKMYKGLDDFCACDTANVREALG